MKLFMPISLGIVAVLAGCAVPQQQTTTTEAVTLGVVQRSVHRGMTQSEIVEALGSPNMVTRDKDGVETWVYDKASSSVVSSSEGGYGTLLVVGVHGGKSSASTSQRTLTLIIKFKDSVVSDFTYRSTSF